MTKYIFVLGGVISGLGKGVTSASICRILIELGYSVNIKKLDPYLNIDPGTMNPIEHGEVYVTKCGTEVDLDIGHYERLGGIECNKNNSTSSGKLLFKLLNDERKGNYLGNTIQLIPHFVDLIRNFIELNNSKYDFIICEVGGSAGDYEASYFLETIRRMIQSYTKNNVMICFVTYILYYKPTKELKTKPTQVAVKQLMSSGLQPDLIFARTENVLDIKTRQKIALYTNVKNENIIQAKNVSSIYELPLEYVREGFIKGFSNHFNLNINNVPKFETWVELKNKISNIKKIIKIGLLGKYVELVDAYYSVLEALKHAGWHLGVKINVIWINARTDVNLEEKLKDIDGIVVPGGFGETGIEDIISAITLCRIKKIPFLGICMGLQLAVIEYARNVLGIKNASSAEFGTTKDTLIINKMTEWIDNEGIIKIKKLSGNLGGSMRLGDFKAELNINSLAFQLYKTKYIVCRHRHRYEIDIRYKENFEKNGLYFSGISIDGQLPEIIEIKDHPFFIGTQGHPEFQSKPFCPEPLFIGLVKHSL